MVADVVGFTGEIVTNPDQPDGAPRKLMDVSRLARLGWQARISLRAGIEETYRWYLEQPQDTLRVK
jgi:nucleoside-diphosphate-sugar epimerase